MEQCGSDATVTVDRLDGRPKRWAKILGTSFAHASTEKSKSKNFNVQTCLKFNFWCQIWIQRHQKPPGAKNLQLSVYFCHFHFQNVFFLATHQHMHKYTPQWHVWMWCAALGAYCIVNRSTPLFVSLYSVASLCLVNKCSCQIFYCWMGQYILIPMYS